MDESVSFSGTDLELTDDLFVFDDIVRVLNGVIFRIGVFGGESQLDPPSLITMPELILPLLVRLLLKLLVGEVYTFNDSAFLMNFVRGLKKKKLFKIFLKF